MSFFCYVTNFTHQCQVIHNGEIYCENSCMSSETEGALKSFEIVTFLMKSLHYQLRVCKMCCVFGT